MLTHVAVTVSGKVQGVGFRMGARHKAILLGLYGWVMNTPEGAVQMEVEGEADKVDAFLAWCKEGTFLSQVTNVSVQPGEVMLYKQFEIR